jgi:hypothetical protein
MRRFQPSRFQRERLPRIIVLRDATQTDLQFPSRNRSEAGAMQITTYETE